MTSVPTKCDILRAGAAATMSASACSGSPPQADCAVMQLLAKKDMYIQTKYSPSGLASGTARDIRTKELSIIQGDIDALTAQIQAKYGKDAPVDLTWNDLTECLWNSDGGPGGTHNNKYFKRDDLMTLGYQPQPALGAATLEGKLPSTLTGGVPIWVDHALNPDLAVIIIFAFLIIIFAVLMYNAYKWTQKAPEREAAAKAAWRTEMEAHDPYKGTSFESYPADPDSKWKTLIPVYEAEGYCMEAYRKKLGMPVTDHCEGA